MTQCTCTTDKEVTCIVHPTTRSLKERIAELQAGNERLRMNLDAYKQAEELWCRQDERREAENKRLREALETISRLEPYDGNRHVYHTAGKVARKALAL